MERSLDAVSAQAAEQEKRQIVGENVGRMRTEMIEEIRDETDGPRVARSDRIARRSKSCL